MAQNYAIEESHEDDIHHSDKDEDEYEDDYEEEAFDNSYQNKNTVSNNDHIKSNLQSMPSSNTATQQVSYTNKNSAPMFLNNDVRSTS